MADEDTLTPTPAEAEQAGVVDAPSGADPWDLLTLEQREELVEIEHDDIETTSEVTRAAYLATWKELGWRIKGVLEEDPTTGQLVRGPDPDEPVIVQRTDGLPLEEDAGVLVDEEEADLGPDFGDR